ncbi:hypothetical protein CHS0354_005941, partial [Potamilus streckersoni]
MNQEKNTNDINYTKISLLENIDTIKRAFDNEVISLRKSLADNLESIMRTVIDTSNNAETRFTSLLTRKTDKIKIDSDANQIKQIAHVVDKGTHDWVVENLRGPSINNNPQAPQ